MCNELITMLSLFINHFIVFHIFAGKNILHIFLASARYVVVTTLAVWWVLPDDVMSAGFYIIRAAISHSVFSIIFFRVS